MNGKIGFDIVYVGAGSEDRIIVALKNGHTRVYAFEPEVEAFGVLQKKFSGDGRVVILPFAVDIGDNQEALFRYPNGQSTLANPFFRKEQPLDFRLVWTMRLDTFMHLYGIDRIDYLVVDVPLTEEAILDSLGDRVADVVEGYICLSEGSEQHIPGWLAEHGFGISYNASPSMVTFWRL